MAATLTIGKLAKAAAVSIETIRYYQRRGLLDEPPKPMGGYRRYTPEQTKRVRFIKRAQLREESLERSAPLLDSEGESLMHVVQHWGLSARVYHRVLRVGRSISNLDDRNDVGTEHVSEALA